MRLIKVTEVQEDGEDFKLVEVYINPEYVIHMATSHSSDGGEPSMPLTGLYFLNDGVVVVTESIEEIIALIKSAGEI